MSLLSRQPAQNFYCDSAVKQTQRRTFAWKQVHLSWHSWSARWISGSRCSRCYRCPELLDCFLSTTFGWFEHCEIQLYFDHTAGRHFYCVLCGQTGNAVSISLSWPTSPRWTFFIHRQVFVVLPRVSFSLFIPGADRSIHEFQREANATGGLLSKHSQSEFRAWSKLTQMLKNRQNFNVISCAKFSRFFKLRGEKSKGW